MVKQTLFRTITTSIGTGTVGAYSGGERLGSTPNTAQACGNLQARAG